MTGPLDDQPAKAVGTSKTRGNARLPGHHRFTLTRHFVGRGLSSTPKPRKSRSSLSDCREYCSMLDRRQSTRDKVIYGGVAEIDERGSTRDCVVRNISENGAGIEFSNVVELPKRQMSLTIARKGRSFLANVVWWRDKFVGVAFSSETTLPVSDIEERLRKSEVKKRALQRRIRELLGEG